MFGFYQYSLMIILFSLILIEQLITIFALEIFNTNDKIDHTPILTCF